MVLFLIKKYPRFNFITWDARTYACFKKRAPDLQGLPYPLGVCLLSQFTCLQTFQLSVIASLIDFPFPISISPLQNSISTHSLSFHNLPNHCFRLGEILVPQRISRFRGNEPKTLANWIKIQFGNELKIFFRQFYTFSFSFPNWEKWLSQFFNSSGTRVRAIGSMQIFPD